MNFKPNEVYSRIVEIAATVPAERSLVAFLSDLRVWLAGAPDSLDIESFLNALDAAANRDAANGPAPADPSPLRGDVLELLDRQVRDLLEMSTEGILGNERRYHGLTAPGGERWNNFDVSTFLDCAAEATFHALDPEGPEIVVMSWGEVRAFLLLGQCYE